MSAEYELSLSSSLGSLDPVISALTRFGLEVIDSSSDSVSLVKPGSDKEQIRRWGGDVQIKLKVDRMEILINTVGLADTIIDQVCSALSKEGIEAIREEL